MVYQLLIELQEVSPTIWRRILIDASTNMRNVHHTIQLAMGWENCHLYYFDDGADKITQIDFLEGDDFMEDTDVLLSTILKKEGDVITYVYDFGDDWTHKITLEKVLTDHKAPHLPYCLEGARNCPPEDVGGLPGYLEFIKIMANPRLPEYEEKFDWYGGEYDPEDFELEWVNEDMEDIDNYIDSMGDDWLY
ncbi:MAG: hypothetical protein RL226_2110 [Bacteroidota bacterium]|jgi:hypothetical protein